MFMPKVKSGVSVVRPMPTLKFSVVTGDTRTPRPMFSIAEDWLGSRLAAWCAFAVYATNLNLLYVQTTALTEPVLPSQAPTERNQ